MTRHRLTLKREALAELTAGQLGSVVAASHECTQLSEPLQCNIDITQPLAYCLTLAGPRCIY